MSHKHISAVSYDNDFIGPSMQMYRYIPGSVGFCHRCCCICPTVDHQLHLLTMKKRKVTNQAPFWFLWMDDKASSPCLRTWVTYTAV